MAAGAVCLSVAARDVNVVFIGNSITQGVTLADPATEAPPVHAAQYLAGENRDWDVRFRNCGVSGMTTLNFLPVTGQEFPNVVGAARELSVRGGELVFSIALGTNDSAMSGPFGSPVVPEQYYTNMQVIIDELLRLFPESKVVVQTPIWYSPNTYNGSMYLDAGLRRLVSYVPWLNRLVDGYSAENPGHVFLGDTRGFDIFKANCQSYFTPEDGNAGVFYLHPNKDGAEVLGRLWGEALRVVM